jgi:DNA invertase Pin-like site-specific DNA recombinase
MIGTAYGRTSKETDDAFSVSSQIDACLAYADANTITVPDGYQFREEHTGRVTDRPEYNKIRALIREHKIQALIVYAVDRFARRVSVGEILLDELLENNVQLHIVQWGTYLKNTPEDRLRFNFETTFSGFEREKFIERASRGKKKKASLGYIVGNNKPPYGFTINATKTNFDHSAEAPIAREVLLSYGIEQMRSARIVERLNEKGYKTPGVLEYEHLMEKYDQQRSLGMMTVKEYERKKKYAEMRRGNGKWSVQSIYVIARHHEIYAGTYHFSVYGQKFSVPIPPIISQEEAEEVKKQLAVGRSRNPRRAEPKYNFLMARRLRCALCKLSINTTYNERGYCYYRCWGTNMKAYHTCNAKPVRRELIDGKAKEFVTELLLNPRRLFAWWQEQQQHDAASNEEIDVQIAGIQKLLDEAVRKYHRILDRLTDNLDDDEVAFYNSQKEQLKILIGEYRDELQRLTEKRALGQVSEEIVQDFLSMGEEYRDTLGKSTDPTFWRGLIDDLDITGIVGRDEEQRRYIDFNVFGKKRRRFYLITEPNNEVGEQSRIDFAPTRSSN